MEIINYREHEMIPLTDKEIKFYEEQKDCHLCKKEFCYDENDKNRFKLYQNSEIIAITEENLDELLIAFAI